MNSRGHRGPRCLDVFCHVRYQSEGQWKVPDAELLLALPKFERAQRSHLPSVAEAAAATAEAQGKKKKKSYQYPPPVTEIPASSSPSAVAKELASMNIRDL